MNTTIGCPIPGAIQPNNLVKIIDKAYSTLRTTKYLPVVVRTTVAL